MLILSLSDKSVKNPYFFTATQKNIFSIEELLYHCFYYWKQSIDDFISGEICKWIADEMGMPDLSNKLKQIKNEEQTITSQYVSFLRSVDYFNEKELKEIEKKVFKWENMEQWKRLKEKADMFLNSGMNNEAVEMYEQSLGLGEEITVLNNLGVAFMRLSNYQSAMEYLQKAHLKEPFNEEVIVNIANVLILQGEGDRVEKYLEKFEFMDNNPKKFLAYAKKEISENNNGRAIEFYLKAHELGDNNRSLVEAAALYKEIGESEKALELLDKVENKASLEFNLLYAHIKYDSGDLQEAVEAAKLVTKLDKRNIDAWLLLTKAYHKQQDIPNTEKALLKIFSIDPENEQAKFEYATMKKSQGLLREYQSKLKEILYKIKKDYREKNGQLS